MLLLAASYAPSTPVVCFDLCIRRGTLPTTPDPVCQSGAKAQDLSKHLREEDRWKVGSMKRLVTFVGKFADWKRLDAVLYAAKEYEAPVTVAS